MNIILFGPPGAGKGTQAYNIAKFFNLHKVSTGDLLRKEIRANTALGSRIKSILEKGLLVSDDIINDLIVQILSDKKFYNCLIFDGYPRNLSQAKNLDSLLKKYKQKISCIFSLNANQETIIKRILSRQICTNCGLIFNEHSKPAENKEHNCDSKFLVKRSDDNESTITKRFETYLNETLPVLDFYKEQNLLHQIDGLAKIDQIFEKIRVIIASLEA